MNIISSLWDAEIIVSPMSESGTNTGYVRFRGNPHFYRCK